jgi:hypothetical protein
VNLNECCHRLWLVRLTGCAYAQPHRGRVDIKARFSLARTGLSSSPRLIFSLLSANDMVPRKKKENIKDRL